MKIGSLFAGIGGFDLAARWMGWETSWYSEIDPYASAVMKKHFPDAVNLGDITQIDGKSAPPVDILCGGFPCQDISLAGKGAGIEGSRSGLWFHYSRLIEEIRPRYAVIENVSALRSRGLDQVLGSLAAIGYDAEWNCIPAAYVGAPHRRDRIWIVAYPNRDGRTGGQEHHSIPIGQLGERATTRMDTDRSGDGVPRITDWLWKEAKARTDGAGERQAPVDEEVERGGMAHPASQRFSDGGGAPLDDARETQQESE